MGDFHKGREDFLFYFGLVVWYSDFVSKRVGKEFPSWATFPAADLVYIDVVKGGSGVAVVNPWFLGWQLGIFVDGIFGCGHVGINLGSSFLGS